MSKPPKKNPPNPPAESLPDNPPSLEGEIERQIGDLLPQGSRGEAIRRISTTLQAEFFSGPIAHPRHLREYESICPGAADRIIKMAENQQNHMIELDKTAMNAEINDQRRGMNIGAVVFSALILAAFITAIWTQNEVIVGLFLGAAAIGAVGKFVNGRQNGSKNGG